MQFLKMKAFEGTWEGHTAATVQQQQPLNWDFMRTFYKDTKEPAPVLKRGVDLTIWLY